jgi:exonuclease III
LDFEEFEKDRKISVFSWNVNGVRATLKSGTLLKFFKEAEPDILCLNETKITLEAISEQKVW